MIEEENQLEGIVATEAEIKKVEQALEKIRNSLTLKASQVTLIDLTGINKNKIGKIANAKEELKIIAKQKKKHEKLEVENKKNVLDDNEQDAQQLQEEVAYWFSKYSSLRLIENDHLSQAKREREARLHAQKKIEQLEMKVANLLEENNKLNELNEMLREMI